MNCPAEMNILVAKNAPAPGAFSYDSLLVLQQDML